MPPSSDAIEFILPDWPAPPQVHAATTTRRGGQSLARYQALNLANHVGDAAVDVTANREVLQRELGLSQAPYWLNQIHSAVVVEAGGQPCPDADASWSARPGQVCGVLTADCLPVLFCDRAGSRVASAHAGWRGLHAGVLSATIQAMALPPAQLMAWFGPAIGAEAFEVGAEVVEAFANKHAAYAAAFRQTDASHWLCDIYQLASIELRQHGLVEIYGGGLCTYRDEQRFYSYRRDGDTGRMASLIWLE